MYMDYPDRKIEWNVWTFDQGLASRVPYEAAARTLTQRKQSFSGYTVRQGLAITMEHNFMMSSEGMANFHNQVTQVVGSIQNTNDLDVHMALINAPSYLTQVREKYFLEDYMAKSIRDYVDMFGFVQKNMNAVDIIIEDTRAMIKNWGGDDPDFMLSSGKLTYQLTMTQERTSYYTQGVEGQKLLKQGPDMTFYRGLKIIKSKAFSLDEGSAPRDLMRRRVRVAEFYVGHCKKLSKVELYDENSDSFASLSSTVLQAKSLKIEVEVPDAAADDEEEESRPTASAAKPLVRGSYLLLRPNIEHYMLGVIIGRGGIDHLGATLCGQTEMSVFDDGQLGWWGMTYKYHERSIVFNERNLHRVWDVAYDGYVGGKDMQIVDMNSESEIETFIEDANNYTADYNGFSFICTQLENEHSTLPSPLPLSNYSEAGSILATADTFINDVQAFSGKCLRRCGDNLHQNDLAAKISHIYQKLEMNNNAQIIKDATLACSNNESTSCRLMYQGTARWHYTGGGDVECKAGCGHHGPDYVGVAAVRNGKQLLSSSAPHIQTSSRTATT